MLTDLRNWELAPYRGCCGQLMAHYVLGARCSLHCRVRECRNAVLCVAYRSLPCVGRPSEPPQDQLARPRECSEGRGIER